MREPAECVEGCGLLAGPGDVYCEGCRSSLDSDARAHEHAVDAANWPHWSDGED